MISTPDTISGGTSVKHRKLLPGPWWRIGTHLAIGWANDAACRCGRTCCARGIFSGALPFYAQRMSRSRRDMFQGLSYFRIRPSPPRGKVNAPPKSGHVGIVPVRRYARCPR